MTFLPIVGRELRVAARKRGTYWGRMAAGLGAVVFGTWAFLIMQGQRSPPEKVGPVLFYMLTTIAVSFSLMGGYLFTADCLSREKREGTLGLLFLTDLKGYDVVLGKLAAKSLSAMYGVMAVVPMLAIPLLMGGVAPGEFGRLGLVAVNALFFSLALGIWVSAMSRSWRKAVAVGGVFIVLITGGLPALGAWLTHLGYSRRVEAWLMLPSAGFNYFLALDQQYRRGGNAFWVSLAVIHGLGWFLLALASVIAPRTWQDKPAGAQQVRWRERWRMWSYGSPSERSAFRRRMLEANAYLWLAARARLKPACVWALLGLVGCGWTWGIMKFNREWLNPGVCALTGVLLHSILKAWVASESGRQLAEDRSHGALELLLSTPLTVRDILRGQWLALERQFLGPVVVVLVADLLFLTGNSGSMTRDEQTSWVCFWVAAMVMLIADLRALHWVGMWQGLKAKSPARVVAANWWWILVCPWLAFALAALIGTLASIGGRFELSWEFFLGLWVGLGLVADLGFGGWARQNLRTEFRQAAARTRGR